MPAQELVPLCAPEKLRTTMDKVETLLESCDAGNGLVVSVGLNLIASGLQGMEPAGREVVLDSIFRTLRTVLAAADAAAATPGPSEPPAASKLH